MESKKDILDFCNKSLFFDYEADDIINQINQLLLCIYTEFKHDISKNRILRTSSFICDIILKLYDEDIDIINDDFFNLRTSVMDLFTHENTDKEQDYKHFFL